jgi:hypothetical protein
MATYTLFRGFAKIGSFATILEAQQAMEQDHAVVNKLSCYVIRNEDGTYRNDYTMHPVENTQPTVVETPKEPTKQTITYKQAVELFAHNNTAYVVAPSELATQYEIIGTDFLLTPKTYENLIANNILKKVVEVVEIKGTVSNRTFKQERVTYVSNIYVEPTPSAEPTKVEVLAEPVQVADTTNEISRLATILTELEFYSINENCYGSGMANLSEVDKVYDDTSCKKQSHTTYVEFFKKQYTAYKEFENVKSWIKANLRAMIEEANKELFSTYGGLTVYITFDKYKVRYWSTTQYQVKRIGKDLRNIRVSKGIKQKDVCSTMQKDRISLLENGYENPTLENLILITRGLGVKIKFE